MYGLILAMLALAASGMAQAQIDRRDDPGDAKAVAAPMQYRSAFADYRAYKEPEIANWRDLNEAVRSAGGHAGLVAKPSSSAREARPREVGPSEAAPKPAPGHAGHH